MNPHRATLLVPNNTAQVSGVSSDTPGAFKLMWSTGFAALGAAVGIQNVNGDPSRLPGCPNYVPYVCSAIVDGMTTGYATPAEVDALRHDSVASYLSKIRVPVILIQGEDDTLFNLNEASATYLALKAQHTPVAMLWQSAGHSNSTAAPASGTSTTRTRVLSTRPCGSSTGSRIT
ncbi:MAG TPA: hypothetical protein VH395_06535 [Jatrophihabitantaceae bacterium]